MKYIFFWFVVQFCATSQPVDHPVGGHVVFVSSALVGIDTDYDGFPDLRAGVGSLDACRLRFARKSSPIVVTVDGGVAILAESLVVGYPQVPRRIPPSELGGHRWVR